MLGRLALHPVRETFVEPEIVPPCHRDEVAEPLVRRLVRADPEDVLILARRGQLGIVEQIIFEGEDGAPILHGAEELAAAGAGNRIELGQRKIDAEIIVVIRDDPRLGFERILSLRRLAPAGHDADLGLAGACRNALEVADGQEEQIGRHPGRGLKDDGVETIARRLARGNGHIAHGHLTSGHGRDEIERRLVGGFVPARKQAAGIGTSNWVKSERALLPSMSL